MTHPIARKKTVLISLAVLALIPLVPIAEYMQRYVVRNGVVTAFKYEVDAPIDGIVRGVSIRPGMIAGDTPVLRLGNQRTTGNYEGLRDELVLLERRLTENKAQLVTYQEEIKRDIEQSIDILAARLTGERADLSELEHRNNRIAELYDSAVVTQQDKDRAHSDFINAQAQVSATLQEMEQLEQREASLAAGLLPQGLSDSALEVQKTINTLELRILETKRRMSESQSDITMADQPEESRDADMNERAARAAIRLPKDSVIWNVDVQDGLEVTKGEPLLSYIDRSRLMVEVAVDDSILELIAPNHAVRIRLYGRSDFIEGRVSLVMGSGSDWTSKHFAANVKQLGHRDGRILVEISDDKLYRDISKFCGVGRSAYAEFEGIGLWDIYFGVLFR